MDMSTRLLCALPLSLRHTLSLDFFALLLLLQMVSSLAPIPVTASEYTPTHGFAKPDGSPSHSTALGACQAINPSWTLPMPKSLEEQQYVRSVANDVYGGGAVIMMGGKFISGTTFTAYKWNDGASINANQFEQGEPNGYATEPCLELIYNGLLNDCSCGSGGALCQGPLCSTSACSISGTVSIRGSPPRCECVCATGWGGPQCDQRTCTNQLDCRNSSVSVSGFAPNCSCVCSRGFIGRNCRTATTTLSISQTATSSSTYTTSPSIIHTATASPLRSATRSDSMSPSLSRSKTSSTTASFPGTNTTTRPLSVSFTSSATHSISILITASNSITLSISGPTISQSTSRTLSPTGSPSASPSHSATATQTLSTTLGPPSASVSTTHTCLPLDDLDVNDTCTVLRPLRAPFWSANASDAPGGLEWMYAGYTAAAAEEGNETAASAAANVSHRGCTRIQVPYSVWTGRKGSAHAIGIVAADYRVPLKPRPPFPDLLDSPAGITVRNVTVVGAMVVVWVQYDGPPTLNSLRYRFGCSAWARCPVPMDGVFEVELLESGRLFPVAVADAVEALGQLSSVTGALLMIPTTVAQLGTVGSLRAMSRCQAADLEADDGQAFNGGMLNPLGLRVGGGGKGAGYARGAVVMALLYAAAFALVMAAYTTISYRVALWMAGTRRKEASGPVPLLGGGSSKGGARAMLAASLVGFPSILLAGAAFAMDGAVGAGTTLGAFGSGAGDAALGWAAVALCALYLAHILFVTTARFPLELVPCQPPESALSAAAKQLPAAAVDDLDLLLDSDDDDGGAQAGSPRSSAFGRLWAWLVLPTDKWALPDAALDKGAHAAAEGWQDRYNCYVADMRVAWYCCLEQASAALVCLASALEYELTAYCVARGAACGVLLGAQALIMAARRPVVYRWRWVLMSAVLSLQTAVALVAAVNAVEQTQQAELVMDSLGAAVSLLLFCSAAADFGLVVKEHYRMWAATLRRIRQALAELRRQRRRRPVAALERPLVVDALPPMELPLLADAKAEVELAVVGNEDDEDEMRRATREILRALREFEERLAVEDALSQTTQEHSQSGL